MMMLSMEEVLIELGSGTSPAGDDHGLPPGFRFHPTDEELITFYLASKVFNGAFCGVEIAEIDLNRCEPWELPDVAKMGEREWYFFSLRDRKYPTGLRTNRATGAGYWKATGKDRQVYTTCTAAPNLQLIGMKKTLVFYKGRAPRGEKTKWVMHEYRLDGHFSAYRHSSKEEWVICRIFHKSMEKKNALVGGGGGYNYGLLEEMCSKSNCLPPLLEPPISTLNILERQPHEDEISGAAAVASPPFLMDQLQVENDLKSLLMINNPLLLSQSHIFSSLLPPSAITTSNINLSHDHHDYATTLMLKQCKTESNFSHNSHHPPTNTMHPPLHADNLNPYHDPMFIGGMDSNVIAPSPHELSTSTSVLNRADFQMISLDPPITLPGESWPLDHY